VHVREADFKMCVYMTLDILDRDPAIIGPQQVMQNFVGCLQTDVAPHQGRVRDKPVQRTLKLANIRRNFMR
jgi:hypothetical protein